jgi:purine-nucleoside phosphorylase
VAGGHAVGRSVGGEIEAALVGAEAQVGLTERAVHLATQIARFAPRGPVGGVAALDDIDVAVAEAGGYTYNCGDIMSSDTYYADIDEVAICNRLGLLGIEMEAAALYLNAQRCSKKALTICTISNNIITKEELPVEERQSGFMHMARIALELV